MPYYFGELRRDPNVEKFPPKAPVYKFGFRVEGVRCVGVYKRLARIL